MAYSVPSCYIASMLAVAWMMGALLSFSLMAIGIRELSGIIPVFQILFARSFIGLLVAVSIILFTRQTAQIKTSKLSLHGIRNIIHFIGQYGWYLAIGLLPLAEVFALEFTTPIWTAMIAAIFLNEKITPQKVIAIILGFIGVLIIVRPGLELINYASIIVLMAALCFAVVHTMTKVLSATEKPVIILFYMCLVQSIATLVFAAYIWVSPLAIHWFWLAVIALMALSAHYCLVKAMTYAELTTILALDFMRLPLIAIVGMVLYQEAFEIFVILGGGLMLLGNIILHRRSA